jgi:hypothetical protein
VRERKLARVREEKGNGLGARLDEIRASPILVGQSEAARKSGAFFALGQNRFGRSFRGNPISTMSILVVGRYRQVQVHDSKIYGRYLPRHLILAVFSPWP